MSGNFNDNGEFKSEFKKEILSKLIENQNKYMVSSEILKYIPEEGDEITELTCICGGFLMRRPRYSEKSILASVERVVGAIPKHKKTRIQKKWRKKWAEQAGPIMLGLKLAAITAPPTFVCSKCGKKEGFYGAIGRNMIKVEPLPGDNKND